MGKSLGLSSRNYLALILKTHFDKVKVDILKISKNDRLTSVRPIYRSAHKTVLPTQDKTKIVPTFRDWNDFDLAFFARFQISKLGLNMHDIRPALSYQLIKGHTIFLSMRTRPIPST